MAARDLKVAPSKVYRGTPGERALAITGIISGFLGGILWGVLAWSSYKGWQRGDKASPLFAWFFGAFVISMFMALIALTIVYGDSEAPVGESAIGALVAGVGKRRRRPKLRPPA